MKKLRSHFGVLLWLVLVAVLASQSLSVEDHLNEPNFVINDGSAADTLALEREGFGSGIQFAVVLEGSEQERSEAQKLLLSKLHRLHRARAFEVNLNQRPEQTKDFSLVLATIGRPDDQSLTAAREVREAVATSVDPPVVARVTGQASVALALQEATLDELKRAELIALPALLLILVFIFRSVVAALVPLVFGAIAVITGFGAISLLAEVFDLDALALSLASMIGLAIGVDYSLIMVSRFREELARGTPPRPAAAVVARTAGRTVAVAGVVLVAAMLVATAIAPGSFIRSTTIGVAIVTAVGAISAFIAIPPLLATLGDRINALSLPRRTVEGRPSRSLRLLDSALSKPGVIGAATLLILVVAALPAFALNPQTPGAGLLPAKNNTRQDFERVQELLAPGWSAPFTLVVHTQQGSLLEKGHIKAIADAFTQISDAPGVSGVLGIESVVEAADPTFGVEDGLRKQRHLLAATSEALEGTETALILTSSHGNGLQAALYADDAQDPPHRLVASPAGAGHSADATATAAARASAEARQTRQAAARAMKNSRFLLGTVSTFPLVIPRLRAGSFGDQFRDEADRAQIALEGIRRVVRADRAALQKARELARSAERIERLAIRLRRGLQHPPSGDAEKGVPRQLMEAVTVAGIRIAAVERGVEKVESVIRQTQLQLALSDRLVQRLTISSISKTLEKAQGEFRQGLATLFNFPRGGDTTRSIVIGENDSGTQGDRALAGMLQSRVNELTGETGLSASVGGQGQLLLDVSDAVERSLLPLILGLSIVSWLILVIALRALLAPLIAVLLNVLTVGIAFAALVPLFQGANAPLGEPGYVSVIAVLAIFGITFGLSIDYEVFLLSRIREEWDRTGDADVAITQAVHRTARIITGAALVMAGVFLSFAITGYPQNEQLGIGLTIAILLDATIVRLLILPALLKLCGPRAWWMPARLRSRAAR